MRATEGLHIEWVGDEAVILDPGSGQVHYLNPAAAYVYALIQEYGYDDALERFKQSYEEGSAVRAALPGLLEDMRSKGLLQDDVSGETP